MRTWLILASAVPLLGGCAKNKSPTTAADTRTQRQIEIVLEKCDVGAKGAAPVDADGDGKPEVVTVSEGTREICRTADLNFDGSVDRTTFFDSSQKIRRIESDFDRDGRVDELAFFEGGVLTEKHRATTLDGHLDTWEFYKNGQVVRTERDENGDGYVDQWWEYPKRGCPLIHVDTDGDGRPDPGSSIDYCKETGYTPPPVPGEEEGGPAAADFGSSAPRVEETENRAVEGAEAETPAADEAPAGAAAPGSPAGGTP